MKNIHILPTDKPSRLYLIKTINELDWSDGYLDKVDNSDNLNIHITSDEEIKEGDWLLNSNGVFKVKENFIHGNPSYKKIILTTDQDLIRDGIQPIPDEFLEWFVKNSSCEEVEWHAYPIDPNGNVVGTNRPYPFKGLISNFKIEYKIIIPKEEPFKHEFKVLTKEEVMDGRSDAYEFIDFDKQKTIEEVAERFFNKRAKEEGFENWTQIIVEQEWEFIESFPVEFAKWQQERSYSEEEVLDLLLRAKIETVNLYYEEITEWFNKFKKK